MTAKTSDARPDRLLDWATAKQFKALTGNASNSSPTSSNFRLKYPVAMQRARKSNRRSASLAGNLPGLKRNFAMPKVEVFLLPPSCWPVGLP